jgi:tetratricopeptide (TPR) repeat protein
VLREEDKNLLYAYFSENNIKQCRLMFSPSMIRFMKNLLEWLPERALLCIDEWDARNDVSQLDLVPCNQHPITPHAYLPMIRYIAIKYGFSDDAPFPPNLGSDSEVLPLLLQRGIPYPKQFSQFVQNESVLLQSYSFQREIRQWTIFENDMRFQMKMDQFYLKQGEMFSKSLIYLSYCESLYLRGFCQNAMDTISEIRDRGVPLTLEVRFLEAKCYIALSQYRQAETQIEACISDAPLWDQLYLYASIVKLNLKKYDAFIVNMELYLRYLHQSIDWNHFLTYLIVLRHQNHSRYQSCIQFINQCIKSAVFDVPISIIERLKMIELELSRPAELN